MQHETERKALNRPFIARHSWRGCPRRACYRRRHWPSSTASRQAIRSPIAGAVRRRHGRDHTWTEGWLSTGQGAKGHQPCSNVLAVEGRRRPSRRNPPAGAEPSAAALLTKSCQINVSCDAEGREGLVARNSPRCPSRNLLADLGADDDGGIAARADAPSLNSTNARRQSRPS